MRTDKSTGQPRTALAETPCTEMVTVSFAEKQPGGAPFRLPARPISPHNAPHPIYFPIDRLCLSEPAISLSPVLYNFL
jgi:hypothetical protein